MAFAVMKRQVDERLPRGLGTAELESQRLTAESFGRPDLAEGVRSFLQKCPPKFRCLDG